MVRSTGKLSSLDYLLGQMCGNMLSMLYYIMGHNHTLGWDVVVPQSDYLHLCE